jgi:ADP-heptose:LPS heptosyltransferase
MNIVPDSDKILLIHLGGLGDMCLSESTFLSLSKHFESNIEALGYIRFLTLFDKYFAKIHRIESIKWLHLFSDNPPASIYKRIIFIGKDRGGNLRQRWKNFSKEPLIFIEMYPENQFMAHDSCQNQSEDYRLIAHGSWQKDKEPQPSATNYEPSTTAYHVEDYQLAQLGQYGIKAIKKEIKPGPLQRVILYPERGFQKKKWPPDKFIELYNSLISKNINACILESLDMNIDVKDKISFQELSDIREFFQGGGIFVSNDSGMAHLAGMCGLFSITIFTDFNPLVWHPRGRNLTLINGAGIIDITAIEAGIMELLTQCS